MRVRLIVAALLLACGLSVSLAADKDLTTLIIGVVDEAKNRPVPKASVTVSFMTDRKLRKNLRNEWNSKTNSKGLAEFPEIPAGKIKLQVIAPTYQTLGDEFEISGKEQTIVVKLKRPTGKQVSAHELPEQPAAPAPEKKKQE